jgi:hypothetical protein
MTTGRINQGFATIPPLPRLLAKTRRARIDGVNPLSLTHKRKRPAPRARDPQSQFSLSLTLSARDIFLPLQRRMEVISTTSEPSYSSPVRGEYTTHDACLRRYHTNLPLQRRMGETPTRKPGGHTMRCVCLYSSTNITTKPALHYLALLREKIILRRNRSKHYTEHRESGDDEKRHRQTPTHRRASTRAGVIRTAPAYSGHYARRRTRQHSPITIARMYSVEVATQIRCAA